jgi:hypothetical protein
MTTPFPSPTAPDPLPFSITGTIATWEPIGRWLSIAERHCWVAPGVAVAGLIPGAVVTASGHQDHWTGRWIVTKLTLDPRVTLTASRQAR